MVPSLPPPVLYQMAPTLQSLSQKLPPFWGPGLRPRTVSSSEALGQACSSFPTLNVWWRQVYHIQVLGEEGLAWECGDTENGQFEDQNETNKERKLK